MIYNRVKILGLALTGLILGACSQTGTYETADLLNEQAAAEKAGYTLTPFGTGNANAMIHNCETACITDTTGDDFAMSATTTENWGGRNNDNDSKTLSVDVWNTLTTIEYRFVLNTTANQAGNLQYFDEVSQGWLNAGSFTNGQPLIISRALPAGWEKCDMITEQWRQTGGGAPASLGDVSYALIGICTTASISSSVSEPVCENEPITLTASVTSFGNFTGGTIQILDSEFNIVASQAVTADDKNVTYSVPTANEGSFSYIARYLGAGSNGYNDDDSEAITVFVIECNDCDDASFSYEASVAGTNMVNVVFTYNHDSPLEDAEVKFTFPQIVDVSVGGIYTAPDDKIYSVNNNGNNTVFTWVGDISCAKNEAETFEFEVTAVCNASGKAQIWTSASVNQESLKNENTPNIRFNCSDQSIEKTNQED